MSIDQDMREIATRSARTMAAAIVATAGRLNGDTNLGASLAGYLENCAAEKFGRDLRRQFADQGAAPETPEPIVAEMVAVFRPAFRSALVARVGTFGEG